MLQRYLPPAIVLAAAICFGWPPAQPLDLGEDIVRASSVRWRASDLDAPPLIEPATDPFKQVLVASEQQAEAEMAAVELPPAGPDPAELAAGLQLDGFADMGGRTWAVLNGRPRLPGDEVITNDANRYRCRLVAIESDHIIVRCEQTETKLRLQPFGGKHASTRDPAPSPTAQPTTAPEPGGDPVAPPPQG
jgi:hypothetical protein